MRTIFILRSFFGDEETRIALNDVLREFGFKVGDVIPIHGQHYKLDLIRYSVYHQVFGIVNELHFDEALRPNQFAH